MNCPHCKGDKTQVIDTRRYETVILRVRRCLSCGGMFETAEQIYATIKISPTTTAVTFQITK